jgi:hypothetical protein
VLAPVELTSALRRRRAERRLTEGAVEWIRDRVREDRLHWTLVELDASVLARAEDLTISAAVKTLDAVHLASALVLQGTGALAVPFITGDLQQRAAAAALGLDVVFVG